MLKDGIVWHQKNGIVKVVETFNGSVDEVDLIKDQINKKQHINNGTTTASPLNALADELVAAKEDVKDELPEEQLQTVHDKKTPAYPDLAVSDYQQDRYSKKSVFGRVAVANPAIQNNGYHDSFQDGIFYQNIETHPAPDFPIVSVHCCMFICYCR